MTRETTLAIVACAAALLVTGGIARATPIAPGGASGGVVVGTASIYEIFGHVGSTLVADSTAPAELNFVAGAGNIFTFSAAGGVNCCSDPGDLNTPDGKVFFNNGTNPTNVGSLNGLSGAIGDTQLPLVGLFTTEVDPFGGIAPSTLPWVAAAAGSLSPALHQVFYIGDGKAGLDDALGATLQFTAPVNATRLYIGFADAGSFDGSPGFYFDNPGSMEFTATLLASVDPDRVPAPGTLALFVAAGLAGLGMRRRRGARSTAA